MITAPIGVGTLSVSLITVRHDQATGRPDTLDKVNDSLNRRPISRA